MVSHTCINCQHDVSVPPWAAWPERCPHCYATPFATSSTITFGLRNYRKWDLDSNIDQKGTAPG